MKSEPLSQVWRQGIWDSNPALVQLLGLCPLLAVTTTAVNGLGLGLATLVVLAITNLSVSLIRPWLHPDIRIPIFVLIIASVVTVMGLLIEAYLFELHQSLGIFIPLIVTNCTILARAEAVASRQSPHRAVVDGLAQGIGFLWVLVLLGAMRELIGQGSLFADAQQLLGPWAASWTLTVFNPDRGFLLALLPPGAFLGLALLVAGRQYWLQRQATSQVTATRSEPHHV